MERQPAKVLRPADVRKLLRHVSKQRYPDRATVIALLSFRAGLRACEISGLKWSMVLASNQRVSEQINIARSIAKKGSGRCVPIHPELKSALIRLHNFHGNPSDGPVIRSERDGHMTPGSIVNWFRVAHDQLGLSTAHRTQAAGPSLQCRRGCLLRVEARCGISRNSLDTGHFRPLNAILRATERSSGA